MQNAHVAEIAPYLLTRIRHCPETFTWSQPKLDG